MINISAEGVMPLSDYSKEISIDSTIDTTIDSATNSDNYTSQIVQEIIGEIGFDFIKEGRAMPKLRTCLD